MSHLLKKLAFTKVYIWISDNQVTLLYSFIYMFRMYIFQHEQ